MTITSRHLHPERGRPRPRELHRHWTIPNSLSALWALICFIERLIRPYAPGRQARDDVLLALIEAMSNAYNSTEFKPDHRLVVGLKVSARRFELSIKDLGSGFTRPDQPVALAASHSESGRGLFLIQQVMDQVDWSPNGNSITMRRTWRPPVGQAAYGAANLLERL